MCGVDDTPSPHAGTGHGWARFDDVLACAALVFPSPERVVCAQSPGQVGPVLDEVQRACASGAWAVGYLAYEAAAGLDTQLPVHTSAAGGLPLAMFGLCGPPVRSTPVPAPTGPTPAGTGADTGAGPGWRADWTAAQHAAAVAVVRDQIAAGVTYQANLTDRLRGRVDGDLRDLYAHLVHGQQARYNAYLDFGRHVIASASPELFFEWTGTRLRTRPMKGTAARGPTTITDQQSRDRLAGRAKDRAENLMIVDLLRNDLSRVCLPGTVAVEELFTMERYPTVWQMVSQVTGTPRAGLSLRDVFEALFPCGSVTGAPKAATMAIIRDLEPTPRGVYCGAVGWVGPPGQDLQARFSVAIRTLQVDASTGQGVYGAGGGITWDSRPDIELAELRAKARVLLSGAAAFQLLETMAFHPGRGIRNLGGHLGRLADSAAYFGFSYDPAATKHTVLATVAGLEQPTRVRLLLDREGAATVRLGPLPQTRRSPVRLAIDDSPVDSLSVWLHHKTTRRQAYDDRAARHPHADDVVLLNEHGEATQTTIASLAVRVDGTWWTPPLSSGCLPGVERARLVRTGRLHERRLTASEVRTADALAVLSSLRGWRPAVLLDELELDSRDAPGRSPAF